MKYLLARCLFLLKYFLFLIFVNPIYLIIQWKYFKQYLAFNLLTSAHNNTNAPTFYRCTLSTSLNFLASLGNDGRKTYFWDILDNSPFF